MGAPEVTATLVEAHERNPQAFPWRQVRDDLNGGGGMDLLDYFAGQAMAGLLQIPHPVHADESSYAGATGLLAQDCYAMADAMLAERAKRKAGK